ncbi:MAG: hypothetical protein J7M30_17055 [Deltaproteobacteria bacterium]|nr:hypothetical protein [Deltaproteobacteria bacterium]
MLPAYDEYCRLIADLPERFKAIKSSTLVTYTIGPYIAEVKGNLVFERGYTLVVWELLDLSKGAIRSYSYELNCEGERIWWYDPAEHPEDSTLGSSFPHHKHVHPDIKKNRIPASDISFSEPNLPFLIKEVAELK